MTKNEKQCFQDELEDIYYAIHYYRLCQRATQDRGVHIQLSNAIGNLVTSTSLLVEVLLSLDHDAIIKDAVENGHKRAEEYFATRKS